MTLKQQIGKVVIPALPIKPYVFRTLRFELNSLRSRLQSRLSPLSVLRHRRLTRREPLSVNVGSGGRGLDEWVNVDVLGYKDQTVRADIRYRLPFRANQVGRLYAEHVVEHLDFRDDVPVFFREARRVLVPGGRIRIAVPDGRRWAEAYVSGDAEKWEEVGMTQLPADMPTPMCMLNHVFHQDGEHRFAYDFETLEWALLNAGFDEVVRSSFRGSSDDKLNIDRDQHRNYSLYVEALKTKA